VRGFANDAASVPELVDINARFAPSRNVNVELARSLSPSERLAVWVTDRVGSMFFFFAIAIWTVLWLGWNTIGPAELRFDPGPSLLTWLFVGNVLQLHLMPLIKVGQNLQDRYGELVANADFNISRRTEAQVGAILQHLTNQNAPMLEILRRVGASRAGCLLAGDLHAHTARGALDHAHGRLDRVRVEVVHLDLRD
jgi:uncharacterized membrane protein